MVVSVCLTLAVCPAPMGEPSHESFPSTPPWPCGLGVPSPPTSNGAKMQAFLPHRAWLPQCPKHQPLWSSLRRARPRGAEAPCSVDHRTQGPWVPVPLPDAPAPGDQPRRTRCYVSSTSPCWLMLGARLPRCVILVDPPSSLSPSGWVGGFGEMKSARCQLDEASPDGWTDGQWVESGEEGFGFLPGAPCAQHRLGCSRRSINVC